MVNAIVAKTTIDSPFWKLKLLEPLDEEEWDDECELDEEWWLEVEELALEEPDEVEREPDTEDEEEL